MFDPRYMWSRRSSKIEKKIQNWARSSVCAVCSWQTVMQKRCTKIEILWYIKLVSQALPEFSEILLPNNYFFYQSVLNSPRKKYRRLSKYSSQCLLGGESAVEGDCVSPLESHRQPLEHVGCFSVVFSDDCHLLYYSHHFISWLVIFAEKTHKTMALSVQKCR